MLKLILIFEHRIVDILQKSLVLHLVFLRRPHHFRLTRKMLGIGGCKSFYSILNASLPLPYVAMQKVHFALLG